MTHRKTTLYPVDEKADLFHQFQNCIFNFSYYKFPNLPLS